MIKLKNLEKNYSSKINIGPVNLDIKEGSLVSIVGPNGAGKSTMLLMIGRLLEMDGGDVLIDDLNTKKTPSEILSKKLAILRQENNFVTKLTVKQLVSFGRFPYSKGRFTSEDKKIVDKYISYLGLSDIKERYLDELSGGQRQRVYVAMVLSQETKYILLDEPLNNLDVKRSVEMLDYLKKIAKELNKTILMVIHDINFAAKYSDYICCMKDGEIEEFGKVSDIMDEDKLTRIFDTNISIIKTPQGPMACF